MIQATSMHICYFYVFKCSPIVTNVFVQITDTYIMYVQQSQLITTLSFITRVCVYVQWKMRVREQGISGKLCYKYKDTGNNYEMTSRQKLSTAYYCTTYSVNLKISRPLLDKLYIIPR